MTEARSRRMRSISVIHWLKALSAVVVAAAVIGTWFEATAQRDDLARRASAMTGGNVEHGRTLAKARGCAGCHEIPGIDGANGHVGPPLTSFARRVYVGGVLLNTPDYLRQWLLDPPSIDPKTAMPNVGLNDQEARDVAAFLYTLD